MMIDLGQRESESQIDKLFTHSLCISGSFSNFERLVKVENGSSLCFLAPFSTCQMYRNKLNRSVY